MQTKTFSMRFLVISKTGELRIINAKVVPDPPFEEPNTPVTLTAEIVTIGLDDVTEEDIDWFVELLDPSGQPVPGDPLASGHGFRVLAEWDGRIENELVTDPTSYTLRVNAETCGGPSVSPRQALVRGQTVPEGKCLVAKNDVALTDGPILKIFGENPVLNSDTPTLAIGRGESKESFEQKSQRLKLQESVYRWQTRNKDEIFIEVKGIETEDDEDLKVLVTNRNIVPGQSKSMEISLPKIGGSYRGSIPLNDVYLNLDNSGTDYTVGEKYLPLNTGTFVGFWLSQVPLVYLNPLLQMGTLSEKAIDREEIPGLYPDDELPPREVPPTPENLLALGFEPLEFQVLPATDIAPKTVIKVQNSSDVLYWNFHGGHDGSLGLGADRDIARAIQDESQAGVKAVLFEPTVIYSDIMKDVKTLFLTSCSALDTNDYNNAYTKPNPDGSWPSAAQRAYGGKAWDAMTGMGQNGTVLLGYNDISLSGITTSPTIMRFYSEALNSLSGVVDSDERQALSWLKANLRFVEGSAIDDKAPELKHLGACAITSEGYYYIPYELGKKTIKPSRTIRISSVFLPNPSSVEEQDPVYKVQRSRWNVNPTAWNDNKDYIATRVTVGGLTFSWSNEQ